jgi:hypothetical protein
MNEKLIPRFKIDGVRALRSFAEDRFKTYPTTLDANLRMIYDFLEITMESINTIQTTFDKAATKEDIKKAKLELKRILEDRGKPTKEEIKQFKDLTKRAKNVYR